MKKLFCGIFVFLLFVSVVLGQGPSYGADESYGGSQDNLGTVTGETQWESSKIAGIRISFIDSKGTVIAGSREFMLNEAYVKQKNTRVKYVRSIINNKVSYNAGLASVPAKEYWTEDTIQNIVSSSDTLETIFSDFSLNNLEYALSNWNYTNLFNNILPENNLYTQNYDAKIKKSLTQLMGGTSFDAVFEKQGKNFFMVFEPTTFVMINGQRYFGTPYELTILAQQEKSEKYSNALMDLNSVLRRRVPCASYLQGEFATKIQNSKAGEDVKGAFSKTSYFNGAIQINSRFYRNCNVTDKKAYLDISSVAGNAGVGIGVVWLGDLIDDDLSCDVVNKGINWDLQGMLQKAYETNALDKVIALYPSGIAYKKENGILGSVDAKWYIDNCFTPKQPTDKPNEGDGEEEKPKYSCTPKYNVGTCINGENISYSDANGREMDTEYWNNCVFNDNGSYDINNHKTSAKGELTYQDSNLGSNYCPVYCVESLTANFDKGNFTVKAGSNFVWGNSVVSGSRTCKTKSIDWNQFRQDLSNWNVRIEKAYNEYLVVKHQQDSVKSTAVNNCPRSCTKTRLVCTGEGENQTCTEEEYQDTCYDASGYDYSWKGTSYGKGSTYASSSDGSSHCSAEPTFDVERKLNAYTVIKNNANSVYNNMKSCYTWDEDKLYNVNPSGKLTYSDGYYNYSDTMNSSTEYRDVTVTSSCKETTVPVLTNCDGTKCNIEYKTIQQCSNVSMTRRSTTYLTIKDNAYRYVLKSNHLSIHAGELGNYINSQFTTNYIDVGYGNLPVSYGTKDGIYGYGHNGDLTINYTNLGHIQVGKNSTAVDDILKVINNTDYGTWACSYNVQSELIPDKPNNSKNPKGINVIYRPIDLYDPFPDMDSTGRQTGSNWCAEDDCSSQNSTVQKYILNNRNVVGEDIYNQEPMYTFILTPSIAREIRKYNRKNGYDLYTGSLNGKNYDYVCKESTGGTCISEYLTNIIDITNARNEPGSCVQDRTRNVNDSVAFENCRY